MSGTTAAASGAGEAGAIEPSASLSLAQASKIKVKSSGTTPDTLNLRNAVYSAIFLCLLSRLPRLALLGMNQPRQPNAHQV